ncbi:MAG: RNA polymerase sigma factor [Thermaurantimonas sp.]
MSIKKKYSEEQLVDLLKSKDKEAFNMLYDNYSPILYGIILKIVNSEESAQDVLQDSFIKIWKNISTYDCTKGTLFTWMLNIIRNSAIDFNRSKHVKYKIRLNDEIVGITNEQTYTKNFDHIGIKEIVANLKPEHKEVIETIYFSGYTHEEASQELNLPLGTLKTRVRTAIRQLRELLKEQSIGH